MHFSLWFFISYCTNVVFYNFSGTAIAYFIRKKPGMVQKNIKEKISDMTPLLRILCKNSLRKFNNAIYRNPFKYNCWQHAIVCPGPIQNIIYFSFETDQLLTARDSLSLFTHIHTIKCCFHPSKLGQHTIVWLGVPDIEIKIYRVKYQPHVECI